MDMMGRVGLVEIPVLIAPDQKAWMDRMIKEGKIAIPGRNVRKRVALLDVHPYVTAQRDGGTKAARSARYGRRG